jgi:NADH-quinone oxidoreductase subunit M
VVAPLVVIIFFLGIYPKPVLDRITPSVNLLVHHVETATSTYQPSVATGGSHPGVEVRVRAGGSP